MPYSLLLVGAGQLGSRYLQGMVSAKCQLEIAVIDPSSSALETAKSRWVEAGGEHCHHRIRWENDIPPELETIDLALVVTSAKGRAELVQKIASQMAVRFWVLEKVLAQSVGELEIITRATVRAHGVWVNLPRRMMTWHQSLRQKFVSNGPMQISYSSGYPELAGNAIHFIDLVAWWCNEKLLSINTNGLSRVWFESKRAGNYEVCGEIVVFFSNGTVFTHREIGGLNSNELVLKNNTGETWIIREEDGFACGPNNEIITGGLELQSILSGRLVDDILLHGQCDLPSLEESAALHSVFLKAMLKHWNLSNKRNDACVPIT